LSQPWYLPHAPRTVPAGHPAKCLSCTPSAHQRARAWFTGPAGSDQGVWHVMSLIHTGPHPTSCTARHTGRAYLTAAASAGGSDLPPTRLRCRPRLPRAHNDRTISHTRAFARAPCVRRRLCLSRWFTLPPDLIVRSRLRLSLSSSGPCTFCLSERHKVQFTPEDTQLHDARSAV